MSKIRHFLFGAGLGQHTDDRLLEPGVPRSVVNLERQKNGRLAVRKDYTALGTSTYGGGTLNAFDVVNFDGKLLAFGDGSSRSVPTDLFSFVAASGSGAAWSGTDGIGTNVRFPAAGELREVGGLPSLFLEGDIPFIDVAAVTDFFCYVFGGTVNTFIVLCRTSTGQVVSVEKLQSFEKARIVAISGVFYIAGINGVDESVSLRSLNPATQTQSTLVTATMFPAGDTILAWDFTLNTSLTEIVTAVARDTPATQIRRVSTAGVTQQTIAGPATALDYCTVYANGTRISFCDVVATTDIVRLSTYLYAGGALENGPTTLLSSGTSLQQPDIQFYDSTTIRIVAEIYPSAGRFNISSQLVTHASHALGAVTTVGAMRLRTKCSRISFLGSDFRRVLYGAQFPTGDQTELLFLHDTQNVLAAKPRHAALADPHPVTGQKTLQQLGHIAFDSSSNIFWPEIASDENGNPRGVINRFLFTGRRFATASLGGTLYTAASCMVSTSGAMLVEAGFVDTPVVASAVGVASGAGGLTPNATYTLAVTYEWFDELGVLHTSEPSEFKQVTLGPTEDTIDVEIVGAHSLRRNVTATTLGLATYQVIWLSDADSDQLHRVRTDALNFTGYGNYSIALSLDFTSADILAGEIIYVQSQRPLVSAAPYPCRFIAANSSRMLIGGLPDPSMVQESLDLFPGEALLWSQDIGFFAKVRGVVTGVAYLDERRIVFTETEIFQIPGDGIDVNGNGTFGPPIKLPSDGGCIDWRSIVECSLGLFFQLDTDKIYLLPRGGGAPTWLGEAVRDQLALFPSIRAATLIRADQTVRFFCANSGNTDSIVLVYSIRHKEWFQHGPFGSGARGACEYEGRHVIVNGSGAVLQQSTSETPTAFINTTWGSGAIHPFGPGNWGRIKAVVFYGEIRGNCQLGCTVTFDDQETETLTPVSVTGTAGDPVRRRFTPNRQKCESIRVDFPVTALEGAATAGLAYHYWGLELDDSNQAALLGATEMS